MVESIYFLKPAWCGNHFAGLWPEQGLQPVTGATALRRWFSLHPGIEIISVVLAVKNAKRAFNFRSPLPHLSRLRQLHSRKLQIESPNSVETVNAWFRLHRGGGDLGAVALRA